MTAWGMIGCGAVTEVKSGPALQLATGSSLVAVMARDSVRAEDYARRHGVTRWFDDARALVDDPAVDAVYVATPPSSHRQYALMALAAGKPVYVEKPMARDAAECEDMLRASDAHGVPLFVAYYRRALPRFLKIRALLEEGTIGAVRSVHVRFSRELQPIYLDRHALPWRVRPEVSGGGLFVDLGSHTLDLLDFLLGPLADVQGDACNRAGAYPAEDTVEMTFRCGDGIRGHGHWDFCAATRRDEVEIVGTAGRLVFATFADAVVLLEDASGRHAWRIDDPRHVQLPLVETVVAQLQGRGTCPSSGRTALRTSRVIDQVLAGYRARNTASDGTRAGVV